MMSYPTEAQKGMYIGIFWAIFNLGGVVGSAVAFGNNFHSTVSIFALLIEWHAHFLSAQAGGGKVHHGYELDDMADAPYHPQSVMAHMYVIRAVLIDRD